MSADGSPSPTAGQPPSVRIRDLRNEDLGEVVRIDALHTNEEKPTYWAELFQRFVGRPPGREVGLAAEDGGGRVMGYLLGEPRAFEFGSRRCGWVFAIGVEPDRVRTHVASRLLDEARRRFRASGIDTLRTMVKRSDVSVQSFFRAAGFEGGSYIQLERRIEEDE